MARSTDRLSGRVIVAPGSDVGEGLRWTRRRLLWAAAGTMVAVSCRRKGVPSAQQGARFEGFPVGRVDSFLTPTADFFVRDHFGVPAAASASGTWTMTVEGDVDRPLSLDLEALSQFARLDLPATLECAGNAGRNGIGWPGSGRAWGGASTASFQGVSLAEVLRSAKPRPEVREVVFEGADAGPERGSIDRHTFARSVPIEEASSPSALLATGMNGTRLPVLHGGPLRVVLPGRYATDSVKWVKRIRLISTSFDGFYQVHRYRLATASDPAGVALGKLRIQSEISHPRPGDKLPVHLATEITGVAWGGTGGVARVQVSTDGGKSFSDALFLDPPHPDCWRRWSCAWRPSQAGPRLVMARATDHAGVSQPLASGEELGERFSLSGPDRIQYGNNAVPIIPVTIVGG